MKLPLPNSEYPLIAVSLTSPKYALSSVADQSIKELDIALPEGTEPDDYLITAEWQNSRGAVIGDKMCYWKGSWECYSPDIHKLPAPKPEPKPAPKPEPKAAPKPAPKAEPKDDHE